jgi:hypothetical protein
LRLVSIGQPHQRWWIITLSVYVLLTLLLMGLFSVSVRPFYPRYFLPVSVPLCILSATGLTGLWYKAERWFSGTYACLGRNFLRVSTLGLVVGQSLFVTGLLVLAPDYAHLPIADQIQYRTGYYSGTGIDQAAHQLLEREAGSNSPLLVLVPNIHAQFVSVYFNLLQTDFRVTDFYPDFPAIFNDTIKDAQYQSKAYPADIWHWLADGRSIYVIDQVIITKVTGATIESPYTPKDPAPNLIIQEIGAYTRRGGTHLVRLRQVVGVKEEATQDIFRALFVRPEALASDYTTLIKKLPNDSPATLVLYPPNQAQTLKSLVTASYPNLALVPIGNAWPLNSLALQQELKSLNADNLYMIFAQETIGDPHQTIENWLTTHYFRVD